MPSAQGLNNLIMEKQKLGNNVSSTNLDKESSTFICTECGDGFSQYSNILTHMAVHGPLESFSLDGSSNGFEVPREYVLQENGTLTVVNVFSPQQPAVKPLSPGVLPSHFPSESRPLSPTLRPQSSTCRDVFRPKPSESNISTPFHRLYRCEICSRSFNSLQSLHRHQQYRNNDWGYKCTLCCKIFEGRQEFRKHLQDHANERFHCCNHCGKRFLKVEALKAHQKENHPHCKAPAFNKAGSNQDKRWEKAYTCKKCKLNFFWMSDFQTHSLHHCKGRESDSTSTSEMETEDNSKNLEDMLPEKCYSNGPAHDVKTEERERQIAEDTTPRVDSEHSFTPYRCGLCGDRFQQLAALKDHHRTHQTQEEIEQLNQESQKPIKRRMSPKGRRRRSSNPNGKLHPCKHCHRVFNHSSSLSRHMRYHKGTMHTCTFCGRLFPQRCDLRRHLAMYHAVDMDSKPSVKNGPPPKALNGAKNGDSGNDDFVVSSSDNEQMVREQDPKGKQSGKAGRVNYKCQECGKKFRLLCVYQRHLRYHKKEPSKGLQRQAPFKSTAALEPHLESHPGTAEGGDAKRACRGTRDPDLEKDDVNVEDVEEDFMDQTLNNKENSSEALYECTECTETFTRLETFLQHQTSHSTESNG